MSARLVIAWLGYQVVMLCPLSMFDRNGNMRFWAKVALPLAGDWEYRRDAA